MIIETRKNTYFTDIMDNDMLANLYFSTHSLDEYNYEKLSELKHNVTSSNKKHQIIASLLSTVIFFNIQSLIPKISLMLERERKTNSKYENRLEIFESNLAYLILSDKIKSTKELGFPSDYIIELLEAKKKEYEKSFVKYDYDEKTGRTSQILNGKEIILPYIPAAVRERIK